MHMNNSCNLTNSEEKIPKNFLEIMSKFDNPNDCRVLAQLSPAAEELLVASPVLFWLLSYHAKDNDWKTSDLVKMVQFKRTEILRIILGINVSKSGIKFIEKFSNCQLNNYDDCFLRKDQIKGTFLKWLSSGSYRLLNHFSILNFDLLEMLENYPLLSNCHWIRELGRQDVFDAYTPKIMDILDISLHRSIKGGSIPNYEKYLQSQIIKRFEGI